MISGKVLDRLRGQLLQTFVQWNFSAAGLRDHFAAGVEQLSNLQVEC